VTNTIQNPVIWTLPEAIDLKRTSSIIKNKFEKERMIVPCGAKKAPAKAPMKKTPAKKK
jgi:hypothetical protein